ncbi:phage late control D family protein [Chitiniphilus eburneus]|uniref:phage late control D family protein n=1 Tax=Chitiniphilus eburneus TaxID=2571148 RepID=UPI0035D0376A
MQAIYHITADGQDITDLLNDRLLSLRTTDKPGMESDECELRLDDRDGAIVLPRRGAVLEISLGYRGQPLTLIGRYTVDEIEVSGPPQSLVITGKAADMRASAKSPRRAAWENLPLSAIVATIAARHGWRPACRVQAQIARADQTNESDIHFLSRLARQYNATAKVAGDTLLVLPRQGGTSASGKALAAVQLARADLRSYSVRFNDRAMQGAVKTTWHNKKTAKLEVLEVPNPDAPPGTRPTHVDRHVYPDQARAAAAAKARLATFNRATAEVRLELSGRADLAAERMLHLAGIKTGIDGEYLIDSVEHQFDFSGGWQTTVTCNGGKTGKAKAGQKRKKKAKATTVLKVPDPQ